jgi:hypothetical protein
MFRVLAVTALVLAASAAPALAQEERPSQRYMGCRAADGVDRRLEGVCDVIDEIHSRLEDARGQTRRQAELRMALSSALFVVADVGDEQAYRDCIETARAAQVFYNANRFPTYWAMLQYRVGASMVRLGANGDETARNEAPAILAAGADALDRAAQPELWATLQEKLSDAYYVQSQGQNRELMLQAVSALRAAMEIYRRPVYAEHRARAEERLADLYRALGQEPDPA